MQKAYNIISGVVIFGLGVWIFFLIKANAEWKNLLAKKITPPENNNSPTTAPQTTPQTAETPVTSVTGKEFWESVKGKINEMTIDVKLNNNNNS